MHKCKERNGLGASVSLALEVALDGRRQNVLLIAPFVSLQVAKLKLRVRDEGTPFPHVIAEVGCNLENGEGGLPGCFPGIQH